MGSEYGGDVKPVALGIELAHAFSFQDEAVGIVDEAVEDGIGQGRVADDVMPVLDRNLAGDDGRRAAVSIVDDFEEIAALLDGHGREPPVVEDKQLDPGQAGQQTPVAAIAASECECLEQPRQAVIEDGAIVAAGLVTERAGDPALAGAGRSSVILPGVRRLRFGLLTRFIRAAARRSRRSVRGGMPAPNT
jgi:hypothetical protein